MKGRIRKITYSDNSRSTYKIEYCFGDGYWSEASTDFRTYNGAKKQLVRTLSTIVEDEVVFTASAKEIKE